MVVVGVCRFPGRKSLLPTASILVSSRYTGQGSSSGQANPDDCISTSVHSNAMCIGLPVFSSEACDRATIAKASDRAVERSTDLCYRIACASIVKNHDSPEYPLERTDRAQRT